MSTLTEVAGSAPGPNACRVWIDGVPCWFPAESVWAGGCVHEHVTTDIAICKRHREIAARPFACVRCEPDHECAAQLREVSR